MKHVHIDMIGGLAGDMFLAAALDAELVTKEALTEALGQVGLGPIEIKRELVSRYGIRGTHIEFGGWPESMERDHRHLTEIEDMIQSSDLDDEVKSLALELFRTLGRAESFIHQIPMERVHFHEIGAIDSILDFVGAAFVIHHAGATWSSSKIPLGQGVIQTAHGTVPAMAPATARLLEEMILEPRDVEGELVTPTGAAILKTLDAQANTLPTGRLHRVGYGAGTKSFDHLANVVRLSVYDVAAKVTNNLTQETVVRLCTEIDDSTPEVLAYASQTLLEHGALDVIQTPVYMKKNRAAVQLAVLCFPEDTERLAQIILQETSTLGVRVEQMTRYILPRRRIEVELPWGRVHVKVAQRGDLVDAAPEYEDCVRLSQANQIPLRRVYQEAIAITRSLRFEE